jgi:hypothetical protein
VAYKATEKRTKKLFFTKKKFLKKDFEIMQVVDFDSSLRGKKKYQGVVSGIFLPKQPTYT